MDGGEDTDPQCLTSSEGAGLLAAAGWQRAVVLGDSTAGVSAMSVVPGYARATWTDRVAAALRGAHPYMACLNIRCKREPLLSQVRSRQLADALDFGGDVALLSCGGAELRAPTFDPDAFEIELSRILASLRDSTCQIVAVVSPFDVTGSGHIAGPRRAAVRTRQRLLAERAGAVTLRHGCLHVDLTEHEGTAGPATLWGGEPGRLSSRGHAVAAAAVVRELAARMRE